MKHPARFDVTINGHTFAEYAREAGGDGGVAREACGR